MSQQFIGKYEIVSTLGRGSMGVVYKAMDPEIGRLVAIKTLRSVFLGDNASGAEALQRFRQESRSAGMLRHPNIVMIYEAGRGETGSPYIVMEYIEGKSLEVVLSERGSIDALEVVHYLAQVAGALDYAHAHQVIHRDIKPSNILIDADFKPHLLDFGVAKLNDTSLTPAGTVVGTPSYMSPEQIRGEVLDGGTDIFALAVVAYELLTGVRPFPGKDFTSVVSSIINKVPQSFADVDTHYSPELERVLHRGLAKARDQRFATATDFVDELADVLSIVVDSSGIAGGFTPDLNVRDLQSSESVLLSRPGGGEEIPFDESITVPVDTSDVVNGASKPEEVVKPKRATAKNSGGSPLFLGSVFLFALIAGISWNYFSRRADSNPLTDFIFETESLEPTIEKGPVVEEPAVEEETTSGEIEPRAPYVEVSDDNIESLKLAELLYVVGAPQVDTKLKRKALTLILDKRSVNTLPSLADAFRSTSDLVFKVNMLKGFGVAPYKDTQEVVELLSEAINDENHLVRGFAAKSLGKTIAPQVSEILEKRLAVEDHKVVRDVIRLQLGNLNRS